MSGVIDKQSYFDIVGYNNDPHSLGARFTRPDDRSKVVEYARTEVASEPDHVVPTDYQNCIGFITLIIDVIVALIRKCFCSNSEEEELPQGSYDLTTRSVKLVEVRRNAKEIEIGDEFVALVKKVEECVREVNSGFSREQAKEVALTVARNWMRFDRSLSDAGLDTIKSQTGATLASGLGVDGGSTMRSECRRRGFLMPSVIIERADEVRNKRLHQSHLTITMPVTDTGFDSKVVLFNGIVSGASHPVGRELKALATKKEGLPIELGNRNKCQRDRLVKVVGMQDPALVNSLMAAIGQMDEDLMPLDGELKLYVLRGKSGKDTYVLEASNLLTGRLKTVREDCSRQQRVVEESAKEVCRVASQELKASPHAISYELVRDGGDTKWSVRIKFTPKETGAK